MPAGRIRTGEGYLTDLGKQLGEERLHRFIQGEGTLRGMALFLTMAVTTAPQSGYSDTALALIVQDAEDVRKAAGDWADDCIALAEQWGRQRDADERERAAEEVPR